MNLFQLLVQTFARRQSRKIICTFRYEALARTIRSKTGMRNHESVPLRSGEWQTHRLISRIYFDHPITRIDISTCPANNCTMARPEVAHRIKSYSAATGFVYQYQFVEV